jgi:hypothetical protein
LTAVADDCAGERAAGRKEQIAAAAQRGAARRPTGGDGFFRRIEDNRANRNATALHEIGAEAGDERAADGAENLLSATATERRTAREAPGLDKVDTTTADDRAACHTA